MFTGCTVNLWAIWLPKCVTEKPTRATEVSFGVIFSKKVMVYLTHNAG